MLKMSEAELSAWIKTHRTMEGQLRSNPERTNVMAIGSPSFSKARSRPKPSTKDTRFAEDMACAGLEALMDISMRDPDFGKIVGAMPRLIMPLVEAGIRESAKIRMGDWRYGILEMFDSQLLDVLVKGFMKNWKKHNAVPKAKPKMKARTIAPKKGKKPAKKKNRK